MSKPPPEQRPRQAFRLCCEGCGRAVLRVADTMPQRVGDPPYRVSQEQACVRLDAHEGRSWAGWCRCGRSVSVSVATVREVFWRDEYWASRVPRLTIAQVG